MPRKPRKPRVLPIRFRKTEPAMSGSALRDALEALAINQSEFARLIGTESRTVRGWLAGHSPVPMAVAYLVTLLIDTDTNPEDLKL